MIICCKCDRKVPVRSLLFSPGLSVADVECPYCKTHLHAGQRSKCIIWTGLIFGGVVAGISAYYAFHLMGWSKLSGVLIIFIVSIIVATILTAYSWWSNDFYLNE